ncbi:MAG: LamG domain-containing protein [Tannerellaceae bacterium]|nr:LamG domain-containing protein [Tannerellaceae bacterium]
MTPNQTGIIGTSYLSGANDVVNIGDVSTMSFGDGATDQPFSVSTWINPTTISANMGVFTKNDGVVNYEYMIIVKAGGSILVRMYSQNSGSDRIEKTSTQSLNTSNGWYHLTVTYDGSGQSLGIKIYIDGIDVTGADSIIGTYVAMQNTASSVYIGRWSTSVSFIGYIDQTAIWAKELSPAEVALVYNSGSGLPYTSW